MAKYTYDSILAELKKGVYHSVYYLMGEESYFTDRLVDYISKNVLSDIEQEFNLTVFYGLDTDIDTVISAARRYPMMAEHQVIIVKEAQMIKNIDALINYLRVPQPSTLLVFAHKNGSLDKRKKVAVELERCGVVLDSKKVNDNQLPQFINNYMREKGLVADNKAVLMLAESVGADLSRMAGEIDKLSILKGEGSANITPDMIEEHIGISKEYNNFELQNAIVNKDIYKANRIINYFAQNQKKNPIQMTLPLLFSFFSNLMMAYYAPDKSERGVSEFLGIRWGCGDYVKAMRNYRAMHVMEILHLIRLADAQSKGAEGAAIPAGEIMRELLYKIMH